MPCSRFKVLLQNFQFVDNSIISEGGEKLFKISPVTEAARKKCLKVEVNTVNEQIIPSKTKYTKIRQYNAKKPCKWEFKNIVRAEKSDFMSDLDLYCGKEDRPSANYDHLSASAQSVARLCPNLPRHADKYISFVNWFRTLDLLLYLKSVGLQGVGTIRANRLQGIH